MRFLFVVALIAIAIPTVQAGDDLEMRLTQSIRPFLQTYCVSCHNPEKAEGDLDLQSDRDLTSVVQHFRRWMIVLDRLQSGEMPPQDAEAHPTDEAREEVVQWISDVRHLESQRRSGDPGIVPARRLSNSEYNHTIRDLTGFDLRPAQAFPIDPANQEGFDNSGESLTMSPALVKKYLEAARSVADHLVLTPTGIDFAPHPVITDTDRDKYCVNRIIDFYQRQRLDYTEFFDALWRYKHRSALGLPEDMTLDQLASQTGLSPKYLKLLWSALHETDSQPTDRVAKQPQDAASSGPMSTLRMMWRHLPQETTESDRKEAEAGCQRMRDFVMNLRSRLVPEVDNLTTPEVHKGSQPLVLWKNRQFVANRRRFSGDLSKIGEPGLDLTADEANCLAIPSDEDERDRYDAQFHEFCSLFPDAFLVSERARVYLDPKEERERTGRLLSAGFHSQMGYFRDDQPLFDLILDDRQQRELDQLWLELDFITSAPMRQYTGFIWFDRTDSRFMRDSQFDRFRAEDKDCTSEEKVRALAETYLTKAEKVGGNPEALRAIQFYFDEMSRTFRMLENLKLQSEMVQLEAIETFAARAFRRPLSDEQRSNIRSFYRVLRNDDGLSHEDAIRDSVVAILMSPHFCYRLDLPKQSGTERPNPAIEPLDDHAIASRLSYFLWSSMPDQELLDLAASGQLHQSDVLHRQVERMLRDRRARGFVIDFAGNWLGFRQFQQHNGVDRNRFPEFTDELRQAMYEEPVRLIFELVQNDRSILELLYADYTFVNPILARHYRIPDERIRYGNDSWGKVDGALEFGRGGLMPMGVFLTFNSPGLRTSPVKRGNWLVKYVLGEQIPAPPAAVPELPSDESKLGDLTLREALQRHRADPNCAACHDRIDSFGLVFEQYGPIGEFRERDLGGRPVDSRVHFPDGSEGIGIEGLRDYIRRQRENDFVECFCRKLLAYGLGRSLQLSDETAIMEMKSLLAAENHRIEDAVQWIVTSKAFLNKRTEAALN